MKSYITFRLVVSWLCCLLAGMAVGAPRYVLPPVADRVAGFSYSGYTPTYATIQAAVNAAVDGEHVILLPGTFKLSAQTDIEGRSLFVRALSAADRDRTIVDGQGLVRTFSLRLTSTTVRDLTLRNGKAPVLTGGDSYGGAVYIEDGGAVENCVIENSTAVYGGGIRLYGTGMVRDSIIRRNSATASGGGVQTSFGGTVTNCIIYANNASDKGGGVYCFDGGEITQSTIYSNTAYYGGGVRFYFDKTFRPKVSRSRIYSNKAIKRSTSAATGGGLQVVLGGTVENCLIHDNEADGQGGGVYVFTAASLMNNTIAHNLTKDNNGDGVGDGSGGGVHTSGGGTLQNNILMNNNALTGPNYGTDGTAAIYRNNLSSPSIPGNGNIGGLPLFESADARNYRLQPTSPCIDTGSSANGAPLVDYAGMLRPVSGKTTSTLRVHDIGAYEYAWVDDVDGDKMPTWWELAYGLNPNSSADATLDPDEDGLTSLSEYQTSTNLLQTVLFDAAAGLNPNLADTDGDGLSDGTEVNGTSSVLYQPLLITNPLRVDTDGDGFSDKFEIDNNADPTDAQSFLTTLSGTVSYGGTLQNTGSVHITVSCANMTTRTAVTAGLGSYTVTNIPTRLPLIITAYRDGNNTNGTVGVQDAWEPVGAYAANPLTLAGAGTGVNIVLADSTADTDLDGLSDFAELFIHGTLHRDDDTDADGMVDGWEVFFGLNPLSAADATLDPDADGLTNLSEYLNSVLLMNNDPYFAPATGLNPNAADSDGDGMPDGWEYFFGLNPLGAADAALDPDSDGLTSLVEYQISLGLLGAGFDPASGLRPKSLDTDGDGMRDGWESLYMPDLNPLVNDKDADPDYDGLTNLQEFQRNTHPLNPDTDGDGMPDGWEVTAGLNPLVDDAGGDADSDGLSNVLEYELGTDPLGSDSDGDFALDGAEVTAGTDPLDPESYPLQISGVLTYTGVQTGVFHVVASQEPTGRVYTVTYTNAGEYAISGAANRSNYTVRAYLDVNGNATQDAWEAQGILSDTNTPDVLLVFTLTNAIIDAYITLTDPNIDSDGDGLTDYDELYLHGTNPNDDDTDGDGMPDGWEVVNALDPLDWDDNNTDSDGDGLKNLDEFLNSTDPHNPDTDGDGLSDGQEVLTYSTDPLVPDTDADGLTDAQEVALGTNPRLADSDADGFSDGVEVQAGSDPLNVASFPVTISGTVSYGGTLTGLVYVAAVDVANSNAFVSILEAPGAYSLTNVPTLKTYIIQAFLDTDANLLRGTWEAQALFAGNPVVLTNTRANANMVLQHPTVDTDGDGLSDYDEVIVHGTNPNDGDSDGDSMPDGWEVQYKPTLDPLISDAADDPDGDGLPNQQEYGLGTNPISNDTDGDGMPDGWEVQYGLNPLVNDAGGDADSDGLNNLQENQEGTDPTLADTDGDGFGDAREVAVGSDPLDPLSYPIRFSGRINYGGAQTGSVYWVASHASGAISNVLTMVGTSVVYNVSNLISRTDYTLSAYRDSNRNGVADPWEASGIYAGNPILQPTQALAGVNIVLVDPVGDSDSDGLSDFNEIYLYGTNPGNPDTDGDGMPDGWEVQYTLNPLTNDAAGNTDNDGLSNLQEYQAGTHPKNADTDADGMPDGWEVQYISALNPLVNDAAADPDTDGLPNLQEFTEGTDPTNADSDGDGMPDGWEVQYKPTLNPLVNDAGLNPDNDGLSNLLEYEAGTDPTDADSDNDTHQDGFEVQWQSNPMNAASFPVTMTGSIFQDGLSQTGTVFVVLNLASNANLFDSFNVGSVTGNHPFTVHPFSVQYVPTLSNYWVSAFMDLNADGEQQSWEPYGVAFNGTNSISPTNNFSVGIIPFSDSLRDTDSDGLTDFDEVTVHGTDPALVDTDNDGFSDFDELMVYGTAPLLSASFPASIGGPVNYAGTQTGPLWIVVDGGFNVFSNAFGSFAPGLYRTPTNLPTLTNYAVIAFIDANTNGVLDLWEPRGIPPGSPFLLTGDITDAAMDMVDPSADTDGDGLTDYEEFAIHGTDPLDPDSDGDGMPDGWEVDNGLDPLVNDAAGDLDGDGLSNFGEYNSGPPTDTDPNNPDTDGDELLDGEEVTTYATDPLNPDTDGDGMPDGWEVQYLPALNPLVVDADDDPDSDGLTNLEEFQLGTDPTAPDSDGDGLEDGEEVTLGTDPVLADSDGDAFDDFDEIRNITSDPLNLRDPMVVDDDALADPVKNDPNNSNYFDENGSRAYPFDSIQEGVNSAEDGFVVLVKDGAYKSAGNYNINLQGKTIRIRSRNGYAFTQVLTDIDNGFICNTGEGTNTVIEGFTIRTSVADLGSAGILVDGTSPILRECRFFDCGEAGVLVRNEGRPLIEDCLFEENQGAIRIESSHPRIERSIMRFNQASLGGGIRVDGTAAITSQPVVVNCLIVGNRATDTGAGIYAGAYTRAIILNTTIADNVADVRGGGIYNAGDTKFLNGILWGNTSPSGPGFSLDRAFETSYSCMQSPRPTSIGVFVLDPQFAGLNDYAILSTSPCIDAGTDNIPYSGVVAPTNDIRGESRPRMVSKSPGVDVGAYEYQPGGAIYVQRPGQTANQVLEAGLPQTVAWTYDGAVGTNLMLEYTFNFLTDPAVSWQVMASNVYLGSGGSGSYIWTLPVTNAPRCYVRIRDVDNPLVTGVSALEFAITNGIQIYSPTGAVVSYYLGQTVNVAWASSPGTNSTATLGLSTNGGALYRLTNAAHVAGGATNAYGWFLDSAAYLTTNGRFRVVSGGLTNTSASVLSICGLGITSPQLGATVQTGATVTVRWVSLGAGARVNIDYSSDGGGSYVTVSNGVANVNGTNQFAWIPFVASTNALLRISSTTDVNIVGILAPFTVSDVGGGAVNLAGDGIPDVWKLEYGLDPENLDGVSLASDDPDGDGASNYHEWQAGTDPLSDSSVFGIVGVGLGAIGGDPAPDGGSGFVVRWRTVPGRRYFVEAATVLAGPWINVSGVLQAIGEVLEWTDPAAGERRFYRIGTPVEE